MIRADLHLHTLASDGVLSPEEIARRVKEAGVKLFSVTDHDNMGSVARAAQAAQAEGLLFVRGIEISAYCNCGKTHVLGYGCQENETYERFLRERVEGSYVRAEDIIQKANAYLGTKLTLKDAEEYHLHKNAPVHTMHVVKAYARLLNRECGELYRELFSFDKPAYSELCRPSPEDAIQVIHGMNGLAFLAHPMQLNVSNTARSRFIDALCLFGLDGIECYHASHTKNEAESFALYAKKHDLLVSGGSDFHADGTERILGKPEFFADDELLQAFGLA